MRSHSLMRLASRIYNTPHLITPEAFGVVLDYLEKRNYSDVRLDPMYPGESNSQDEPSAIAGDIGVLRVDGSLTYKPVQTMCGEVGTSYQQLVSQMQEMADAGVRTVVMEVSSGGGEAGHCFEAANEIRAIANESNIMLIGYADTIACSAAYALISVCDYVVANPSARLGSIGVVVALLDQSKALEQAGLKRVYITAGANKVPFAADGTFKQEFLDEIQVEVDRLYADFASHVSNHTGLSTKTITGFEAKVYDADQAVKLGLANAVMTSRQFTDYVVKAHKGNIQ